MGVQAPFDTCVGTFTNRERIEFGFITRILGLLLELSLNSLVLSLVCS